MALASHLGLIDKHVSERHYYASQKKQTLGQVAGSFRKKGFKVYAKDLLYLYRKLNNRDPEWHHSGFYNNGSGKTMGRTFFLSETDIQQLSENLNLINNVQEVKQIEIQVCGFYYIWDHDYSGRYGKKIKFKVLQAYEGDISKTPKNFVQCDEIQFMNVRKNEGKKYYGWDEPNISEF